jgi:hypothetical protein
MKLNTIKPETKIITANSTTKTNVQGLIRIF